MFYWQKNPIDSDHSASTEEIETNPKTPKFKVGDRVTITKHKIFLAKVPPKTGQEKYYNIREIHYKIKIHTERQ